MSVRNLMIKDVISISSAASIKDVADLMLNKSVGSIIILENSEPIGIVTEGDLVRQVIAQNKDPNKTIVKEVMSQPLVIIGPNASIDEAGEIMTRHGIERLPVIEDGKLIGIIAEQELTEWHAKEFEKVKRKLKLLGGKK
ncbi:MAG: cyclic nucleotide-binding/CBS domain-containing protein [Promethearchaeota archaeon]